MMDGATGSFQPRRIVLVAHSHRLGGIERHVVALAAALAARGHAVAYAGPLDGWMGSRMQAAGHACVNVPMHGMYDPWSAWRLARFARTWRADVLHGHAQRGARYAEWAARWCGVPAVATAHSTNAWRWFARGTQVVAVSEAVRRFLVERGLAPGDVRVVYSGVPDFGPLQEPDAAPVGPGRPLRLGMVARLERVKGHDLALAAVAALRDRVPLTLALAGADDTEWARTLRAQAASLGVADEVAFLGERSDVPAVLTGLDVVLAPSRRESLCLSLIEAAAAGRPGIGAAVGGIPEVIEDGRTGLLVPPEDAGALAQAILSLAEDGGRRRELGTAARRRYQQRFTVAAMLEGLEAVYTSAIVGAAR